MDSSKRPFILWGWILVTFLAPFLIIELSGTYKWLMYGQAPIIVFVICGLVSLELASLGQTNYGIWVGLPQSPLEKMTYIVSLFVFLFFVGVFMELNSIRYKISSVILNVSFILSELATIGFVALVYHRRKQGTDLQKNNT